MKNIHPSILLAALCMVSSAPIFAQTTSQQPQTQPQIQPSEAKYQEYMTKGRAIQAEQKKGWLQHKAVEAVQAFTYALQYAPTPLQRAVAYAEGGDALWSLAAYPGARDAFKMALQEKTLPNDLKLRALLGVAQCEFRMADNARKLQGNTTQLRANYDAVLKAGKFSDRDMMDIWHDLATISAAEGKYIEAAREEAKIFDVASLKNLWKYSALGAVEYLKKATALTPTQQSEAAALTDKVFKVYLASYKEAESKHLAATRMDYANLLAQFGQPARAETVRNEIANDTTVEMKLRSDAIVQIAQSQVAQKKYDAALQTVERLASIPINSKERVQLERAKILMAQDKLTLATSEYLKVLTAMATPDEKAQAFLGLADVYAKEAEALRLKKAPEADIKAKLESQKRQFVIAQLSSSVSASLRHEACLKLAAWETAHGTAAEAKKWSDKAATFTYLGGKG